MKYLWLALSLIASPVVAQDTTDVTAKYSARDFSAILKPKSPFLGFVGSDYQKLDVVFLSVTRASSDTGIYNVRGYTLLKGKQTSFSGTVAIDRIERLKNVNSGIDDTFKVRVNAEGVFHGHYLFVQTDSSQLSGTMTLNWYVDRQGRLLYDDIDSHSDGYRNSQYTGHWTLASQTKTANWGEYRIPASGDLDIGAGEFSANPKYSMSGW